MRSLKKGTWGGLVLAVICAGTLVHGAEVDIVSVLQEAQKMSQETNEMSMVTWLPEEYWRVSLETVPGTTATLIETVLRTIRPYTIFAVVSRTTGPFGGVTFRTEEWVRANTRLIDFQGTFYAPKSQDHLEADVKNMV